MGVARGGGGLDGHRPGGAGARHVRGPEERAVKPAHPLLSQPRRVPGPALPGEALRGRQEEQRRPPESGFDRTAPLHKYISGVRPEKNKVS